MKDAIDFFKDYLSGEIIFLSVIFLYLLYVIRRFYGEFLLLSKRQEEISSNQAQYIKDRLDSVEKYLEINDKAVDLRKKQAEELLELAEDRERLRKELENKYLAAEEETKQLLKDYETLDSKHREYVSNSALPNDEKNRIIGQYSTAIINAELGVLVRHEIKHSIDSLRMVANRNRKYIKNNSSSGHSDLAENLVLIDDLENGIENISVQIEHWERSMADITKMSSESVPRKLKGIVSEALEINNEYIFGKCLQIEKQWDVPEDLEIISEHIEPIKFVLLNLLDNAIKGAQEKTSINLQVKEFDNEIKIIVENSLNENSYYKAADIDKYLQAGFSTTPNGSGNGLFLSSSMMRKIGGSLVIQIINNKFVASISLAK